MISKEKFCEIIERMKDIEETESKINEIYRNSKNEIMREFSNPYNIVIPNEDIIVELLEDIFGLGEDDTIGWWVYDMDYGKYVEKDSVIDNGKFIDLTTPEKLYDYLISIKGEKNG